MKTLTYFIFGNLETPNLHSVEERHTTPAHTDTQFEVVENETVVDSKINGLVISGSLFSLSTFKNVVFDSCVFFGSKLENCNFIGCTFINCEFQFSSISYCNFRTTNFSSCKWDFTPTVKSKLYNCELDNKSHYFITKENCNHLENCKREGKTDQASEITNEEHDYYWYKNAA